MSEMTNLLEEFDMIDARLINQLRKGELDTSLERVLRDSLLSDPLMMWVVSGQLVFSDVTEGYFDTTTFVSQDLQDPSRFSVGVIAGTRVYRESYSQDELRKNFPQLFNYIGNLISMHP